MKAKFDHHCDNCRFLGHFLNHDVYLCDHTPSEIGPSLIARFGDEVDQYCSTLLKIFQNNIKYNHLIRGDWHNQITMGYREYLFKYALDCEKAWLLALAIIKEK